MTDRGKEACPGSTDPSGGDNRKARALQSLSEDQSDPAVIKQSALSNLSENLMEQIVDQRNMHRAWRNVKANKGAPGPDGITLDQFEASFRPEWPTIRQQLIPRTRIDRIDRALSFDGLTTGLSPMRNQSNPDLPAKNV